MAIMNMAALTAAVMLMALPAAAQQVPADITASTPQAEQPATPPAAETAAEEPAASTIKEEAKFGDWSIMCDAGVNCVAQQVVKVSDEEESPVVMIFLEANADGTKGLSVSTPLGVSVQPGLTLVRDVAKPRAGVWHAPYTFCLEDRCLAGSAVDMGALSEAPAPAVLVTLADGNVMGVTFSLEGADDAASDLQKRKDAETEDAKAPAAQGESEPAPAAGAADTGEAGAQTPKP